MHMTDHLLQPLHAYDRSPSTTHTCIWQITFSDPCMHMTDHLLQPLHAYDRSPSTTHACIWQITLYDPCMHMTDHPLRPTYADDTSSSETHASMTNRVIHAYDRSPSTSHACARQIYYYFNSLMPTGKKKVTHI